MEKAAVETALIIGFLLDRVVILLAFHCYGCVRNFRCDRPGAGCSMNSFLRIETFDAQFAGRYREDVFLDHDKGPAAVKASASPMIAISTPTQDSEHRFNKIDINFEPNNFTGNEMGGNGTSAASLSSEEISNWFGGGLSRCSVLRRHSLYNITIVDGAVPDGKTDLAERRTGLSKAFVRGENGQSI